MVGEYDRAFECCALSVGPLETVAQYAAGNRLRLTLLLRAMPVYKSRPNFTVQYALEIFRKMILIAQADHQCNEKSVSPESRVQRGRDQTVTERAAGTMLMQRTMTPFGLQ